MHARYFKKMIYINISAIAFLYAKGYASTGDRMYDAVELIGSGFIAVEDEDEGCLTGSDSYSRTSNRESFDTSVRDSVTSDCDDDRYTLSKNRHRLALGDPRIKYLTPAQSWSSNDSISSSSSSICTTPSGGTPSSSMKVPNFLDNHMDDLVTQTVRLGYIPRTYDSI